MRGPAETPTYRPAAAQPNFADIGEDVEHKRTKRTRQVISSNITSDASGARCHIGTLNHPENTTGPDFWSDEVRKVGEASR